MRIIPVFIPHAGCPHACSFCDQRTIAGTLRPVTPEEVTRRIAEGIEKSGDGAELAFYGGSFTAIPRGLMESYLGAARPFIESGGLASVRVSTRPDYIDKEKLASLRRGGVATIELGAQSMCADVLEKNNRGHTPDDVRRASEMIRGEGFTLGLQMMTGLALDTPEKDEYTCGELIACKPDIARIYPTVVLPGTQLYDWWRDGTYSPPGVKESVEICAKIYRRFESAGVRVIRTGLNTTELLGSSAAAGAYHPAFGELVRSRLWRDEIERAVVSAGYEPLARGENSDEASEKRPPRLEFFAPERDVSQATGQKRSNLAWIRDKYGVEVRIMPEPRK